MSLFTNYGKDFKRSKYLSDMIDILSEQDFNPDLVIGALDETRDHYICVGTGIGGIAVFVAMMVAMKIKKHFEKGEKEKKDE